MKNMSAHLVSKTEKKRSLNHALQSCRVAGFALLFAMTVPSIPDASADEVEGNSPEDPLSSVDLCAWQEDYSFFTEETPTEEKKENEEKLPCDTGFRKAVPKEVAMKTAPEAVVVSETDLFSDELRLMTTGFPIEAMAPAIAEYDRDIAGLIVGIAKKESNWGKRVPRSADGADCFNYWGYKGAGTRGVAMGHGCFGSPEEAVHVIGKRLSELVAIKKTSEPKNLIIWKCGSSCAGHSPESVRKWISDVDIYFRQIAKK